ncbi:hypothetical protein [Inmirania thermothiophila]|uniref:Pyrroloquinoline-quinone binding quinoprotein n=1 Tax=Inmirania thermothiophila TaxID=1750597 RepID=A0A3N1Y9Y6_9GAMM|nr:hypothetical protein [Inmirania thermothiophila]ROR34432.1 hypothetical protein EDC57_0330 [Inmirania thermothiophila]
MTRRALLALALGLWAVAAPAAEGRLLVVRPARALAALAPSPSGVWFAVVPPEPWQPHAEAPPVFIPVEAGGRKAAGSVVIGHWGRRGVDRLAALPGDLALGGRRAYGVSGMAADGGTVWLTGPLVLPERPIGRYFLAHLDAAGGTEVAVDAGPAAVAVAARAGTVYVARNPEPGTPVPVAALARHGGWTARLPVAGTAPFFSWTPGPGIAAAAGGVLAAARFHGSVRVAGAEARSPAPGEMPILGTLPPPALEALRRLLASGSLPPLPAALVVHLDAGGRLRWLDTVTPDAVRVGGTAGGGGMDPARIDGFPVLAADGAGRAYLVGRYVHAVRSGDRRIVVEEAAADETHCFAASWEPDGSLRWLRDVPGCRGEVIGLAAGGGRLVAVTAQEALALDAGTGTLRGRRPLPRARRTDRPPELRWTAAAVAGGRLLLGGTFRGKAELLGQRLDEPRTVAVVAELPLEVAGAGP